MKKIVRFLSLLLVPIISLLLFIAITLFLGESPGLLIMFGYFVILFFVNIVVSSILLYIYEKIAKIKYLYFLYIFINTATLFIIWFIEK